MIQTIETEKSELKTEITSLKSQLAKYQQFKQELIEGNNSLEESISSIKKYFLLYFKLKILLIFVIIAR